MKRVKKQKIVAESKPEESEDSESDRESPDNSDDATSDLPTGKTDAMGNNDNQMAGGTGSGVGEGENEDETELGKKHKT